jgi:acyl carrier protein
MTVIDGSQIIEQLKPMLLQVSNGRARTDGLTRDALIVEDVGLASLDLLEMRFELENHWNLQIADEDIIRLKTVGDVVDLILERQDPASEPNR